jgi:hypothetical protein
MGGHTELTVLDTWRGQTGARWMSKDMDYRRVAVLYGTTVGSRGVKITRPDYNIGFLAVSSGFGHQVSVVPAWRVDEGVIVSLAA